MSATLIGAIVGFGGSVFPAILNFFKAKEDNKSTKEILGIQADLIKSGKEGELERFRAEMDANESARLLAHDTSLQADRGFMGGLRKSVRPVITYAFFILFCVVEISALWWGLSNGESFVDAIQYVWGEETQAIFAAIISFWFGSRAIERGIKR